MRRLRREYVALGAGLLLATVVAVVLLTRGEEEQPLPSAHPPPPPSEAAPPSPPPPPPTPQHQAAVRDGRLVVDGKPFFPIMSWGECTDGFETSLPVGTNLYAANRCGGLEAQLHALGDRALSAAVTGEAIPDPGAVVGVFYPDEPDGQGLTAKTMPTIDPSHGVRFLTLTNHFYSWAAPLPQGRGMYPGSSRRRTWSVSTSIHSRTGAAGNGLWMSTSPSRSSSSSRKESRRFSGSRRPA